MVVHLVAPEAIEGLTLAVPSGFVAMTRTRICAPTSAESGV